MMRVPDHPARRPTRYHWAAGASPLHWVPAVAGWTGVVATGAGVAAGSEYLAPVTMVLSIASLAWSGLWLIVVPNLPRFRRNIDARLQAHYENDYSFQLADLLGRIDPDLHGKVQDITRLRDRAREILSGKFGAYDVFAKDNLHKLDNLAINYLKLLTALSEYNQYIMLVDPTAIETELAGARAGVEQAQGPVRQARERQIDLLENRLSRYHQAGERMELIQAQCHNVETTMKLLVDQAMTAADPQRVGRDIDQVLENIRASEVLTEELATYDDLEREVEKMRLRERE